MPRSRRGAAGVLGRNADRHTSAEFVTCLRDLVAHHPRREEIHVILDHLSVHKTKQGEAFWADHPTVHLHITPPARPASIRWSCGPRRLSGTSSPADLHVPAGSETQTHAVYRAVQQKSEPREMEVCRFPAIESLPLACYRPLVMIIGIIVMAMTVCYRMRRSV